VFVHQNNQISMKTKKLRVVHISPASKEALDGATRVSLELSEALVDKAVVGLILPGSKNSVVKTEKGTYECQIKSETKGGVSLTPFSKKMKKYIWNFLDEFQPDIVHAHAILPLSLIAQNWAKKNDVPNVLTMHLPLSMIKIWLKNELLKNIASNVFEKLQEDFIFPFLDNCDAVIVLNKFLYDDFTKLRQVKNLSIIPNGRNVGLFSNCEVPTLKSKKYLIFIGSFLARKNQEFLVDVMRFLSEDFVLLLAGTSKDPKYSNRIKKIVKEEQMNNVEILGTVPYERIPQLLQKSHLFVSASMAEAQSLAVIESQVSGTPFLGIEYSGLKELLDEKYSVLLPQNVSPKEFSDEIRQFFSLSESKYLEACRLARESVSIQDWEYVTTKTMQLYNKLLNESNQNGNKREVKHNKLRIPGYLVMFTLIGYIAFKILNAFPKKENSK